MSFRMGLRLAPLYATGLKDPVLKERNRSAKQLDALTTALCKPLGEYVKVGLALFTAGLALFTASPPLYFADTKHTQMMAARMVHVTNLTPGRGVITLVGRIVGRIVGRMATNTDRLMTAGMVRGTNPTPPRE